MKTGKKLLSLLLVLIMVLALCGGALAADKDIVVLYTNDVHGTTEKTLGYDGLAAYKAEMAKTGYVSLVDAGDFVQGGTLNTLSRGEETVAIMNKVGYDVVTLGNHEFDWQIPQLLVLMDKLDAKVVSCNFVDLKTGKSVYDGYTVIEYGDTSIAYVGITTIEAYTKSTPGYFEDVNGTPVYGLCEGATATDFTKFYAQIQTTVDAAKAKNVDYVVALGHLGIEGTTEGLKSTDVISNTTGIDVMLDGHSHEAIPSQTVKNKAGDNVLLSSTGTGLEAIGKLTIKTDGTLSTELVTDYAAKAADVTAFIKTITDKYAAVSDKAVGKSLITLPVKIDGTRIVRNSASALGDFVSDALRFVMGADIAFANGGGLRDAVPTGDLTYGSILKLHPFSNTIVVASVTGQQIKDALEMGANKYPSENGGFLHPSGLTYTIDSTIPTGVTFDAKLQFAGVSGEYRVRDIKVLDRVSGEYKALDLAKTYTVAMNAYNLMYRGDGFTMFKGAKIVKDTGVLDRDVICQYITNYCDGVIPEKYAAPQGRISVIKTAAETFTDVVADAWYVESVEFCFEKAYMLGTSDTLFNVTGNLTNAQFFTILYRFGYEAAMYGKYDTTGENWMAGANFCAKALGFPAVEMTAKMTRGEMATAAAAYVKAYCDFAKKTAEAATVTPFTDCVDDANVEGIEYLHAIGVLDGYTDNTFRPGNNISRVEVAKVVNFLATKITYKPASAAA